MGNANSGEVMAIVCIVIGLVFIALGVQGIRQWYREAAAGGVTRKTNLMMTGGFFLGTLFLLGSMSFFL